MALIQLNVPDDVKERADAAFARSGLTTPYAMRIMVNQVAETGRTPFDGLFSSPAGRQYSGRRPPRDAARRGPGIRPARRRRCGRPARNPRGHSGRDGDFCQRRSANERLAGQGAALPKAS